MVPERGPRFLAAGIVWESSRNANAWPQSAEEKVQLSEQFGSR